ncbi:MAG: hypothetical protein HC789_13265 [Microcoleus sp. CSU_2_2]|nr:hypothetical protein [Microcoleus sp. CSU_2_2]
MIYEYPQGIPEQYAGIVEELWNQAQEVRSTHIQRPRSGNAAAAKLQLDTGAVYNKEATKERFPNIKVIIFYEHPYP